MSDAHDPDAYDAPDHSVGAFEYEHDIDPLDHADGFAILDGVLVALETCRSCLHRPCRCDPEEAPERHRNYSPARARVVREA